MTEWTKADHDAVRRALQTHVDLTDRVSEDGCSCGYPDPRTWDFHAADRILAALASARASTRAASLQSRPSTDALLGAWSDLGVDPDQAIARDFLPDTSPDHHEAVRDD